MSYSGFDCKLLTFVNWMEFLKYQTSLLQNQHQWLICNLTQKFCCKTYIKNILYIYWIGMIFSNCGIYLLTMQVFPTDTSPKIIALQILNVLEITSRPSEQIVSVLLLNDDLYGELSLWKGWGNSVIFLSSFGGSVNFKTLDFLAIMFFCAFALFVSKWAGVFL